ncbi:MAG: hypothetical protein GXO47_06920, partial [Chlorobi bacterium]|nr:hypothetical protein [Chlorobiota bacterium]
MKRTLFALLLLVPVLSVYAQMEQHVTWKFYLNKISDTQVEVVCEATLD